MAELDTLNDLIDTNQECDFSYSRLLDYFNSKYGGDTERTNYVYVILSMKNDTEVSALVKTYNKILRKILLIYYRSEENFPSYWVRFMTVNQQWLWDDLRAFLNEQIKRVFDEGPYSDKLALECITNLREGCNEISIQTHIASKSSDEVNSILDDIVACKKNVQDAPNHMSENNLETNEYREYKSKYIHDIKYLIKYGYCKGYNDVFFEMKAKVSYFPNTKSLITFIVLVILLIPIGMLLMHYTFVVIFFIICILALIKML